MSDAQSRFFGWNTNTDWTKCQSKDCIETIGVFSIDANAETNDFQNICNLSNMINSDRSSYDNGDTSYGTTIEFFNQMINIELERDEKWWSTQNNFHQLLTTEQEESIGDVTISYKKDYFKMEFDGHMYTGMNFELTSESEGVQPCTVFFGSDETFYLENLSTDDAEEVVTDDGRNVAIQKAYGAQSIFLAKTGPLDYKPFCDESLQFGTADPRSENEKKNDSGKTGSPYVLTDAIVGAEVEPEEVDVLTLNYLPPITVIKRYTDIGKVIFVDTMIDEPVFLISGPTTSMTTNTNSDGTIQRIMYNRIWHAPEVPLIFTGQNTGKTYKTRLMFMQ